MMGWQLQPIIPAIIKESVMNTPENTTVEPVANSAIDSALVSLGVKPQLPAVIAKDKPEAMVPLTNQEADAGFKAKKALASLTKDADGKAGQKTFQEWMVVAEGYAVGRQYAMRIAGGKDNGKKYAVAFGKFLEKYDLDDKHLHKSTRSRLIKCFEHRDEIEKWRRDNQEGRVLNNPVLIWAAFSTPSSQPKKPTTARNIVDKLVERFGDSPYAVAETVIKEKCHIAGTKSHNKAMAKAVAEQLQEVVKSAEEAAKKDTQAVSLRTRLPGGSGK